MHTSEESWVLASYVEPLDVPERRPPANQARRALVLAVLGVVFLGFVFGPLALAIAQRSRLAMLSAPSPLPGALHADTRTLAAATSIGRAGLALHLMLAVSALPWILFGIAVLRG